MFSLAFAAGTLIVKDTVRPDITATFNETVDLTDYGLTYTATSEDIPLSDPTTTDNKSFVFNPSDSLVNGFYYFFVNAEDKIGNARSYTQNIVIDVNQTDIFFIDPVLGISQSPKYDITIGTTRNAQCRWSFLTDVYDNMNVNSFNTTGATSHKILSFDASDKNIDPSDIASLESSLPYKINVACKDELNLTKKKKLAVGYDPTPPTVSIKSYSENPVVTYDPKSTITMTSNDRIACSINGKVFDDQNALDIVTYSFLPAHTIVFEPPTIDSNGPHTYTILCQNLAAAAAGSISATVTVSLAAALAITIDSPDQYVQSVTSYAVSTNKEATCTIKLDGGAPIDLVQDATKRKHTLAYTGTTLNGTHLLTASCVSDIESKSATKQFTVDTTPPSTPIINATACMPDKLTIVLSSFDNESTVKSYNYSVSGPNMTVNWTTATSG
ncbi:MAG TPA: hypothetical protein VKE88_00490, partial [Candidatus Nanoarchaeia archaeon]|nr:hypothetical protein [Candidatus Nanoarchaeia archaeon]